MGKKCQAQPYPEKMLNPKPELCPGPAWFQISADIPHFPQVREMAGTPLSPQGEESRPQVSKESSW